MERSYEYLQRSVYSYAVACFPSLWSRDIPRKMFSSSGLPLDEILKKIKASDKWGRRQDVGIYQGFDFKCDSERKTYQGEAKAADFIASRFQMLEPLHPELICVLYDPEPDKGRVKLTKKQRASRELAVGTLKKIVSSLTQNLGTKRSLVSEEMALSREGMHQFHSDYIRNDDPLARLAVHPLDQVPSFYEKDTSLISSCFTKIQDEVESGKAHATTQRMKDLTQFAERAGSMSKKFGLTRIEAIQFAVNVFHLSEIRSELQ